MRVAGLATVPGHVKQHFAALTGLRFVLALWVVMHHLTGRGMMLEPWEHALPPSLANLVRGGYLAVGTFFLLSGFVLARSYGMGRKPLNLRRYGAARVARVYPTYLLSIAIMLPFIADSVRRFGAGQASTSAAMLANYFLLLQGWTGTLPVQWNTPAWSLSCEVFFYCCFPFALRLFRRPGWQPVWLTAGIAYFLPVVLFTYGMPVTWKPLVHLSDFLVGIAAARLYDLMVARYPRLQGRGYWLYVPAVAATAVLIMYPLLPGSLYLNRNNGLLPVNAALVMGLALSGGPVGRWLSTRLAVFLGKASYSMYILHIPLLWWFRRIVPRSAPVFPSVCVYVAVVIVVSALVYRYLEEPANRYFRERLGRQSER